MEHIDKTGPFGNQSDDLRGALHREQQYATRFKEERNEARAEITRVLSELVACQDERSALRARVELLKISVETLQKRVTELTICDCGLPLSTGWCSICDRDE